MTATADALHGMLASIKYGATEFTMMQRPAWRCLFCRVMLDSALDAENSAAHDDDCPVRIAIDALKIQESATPTLVAFNAKAERADNISGEYDVPYDVVMAAMGDAGWRIVGRYSKGTMMERNGTYWHISPFNDGVLIVQGKALDAPVRTRDDELDF